jgi:galactokinase
LESIRARVSADGYKRATYVLEEFKRVSAAQDALKAGNIEALGKLMYDTHEGLATEYEVSCPELDFLCHSAGLFPEVVGCRMMGGGFGGCTLNLVRANRAEEIEEALCDGYERQFNKRPNVIPVNLSDGTHIINLT